jgi:hypothetical protein
VTESTSGTTTSRVRTESSWITLADHHATTRELSGRERASLALLRNHARPDAQIAAEAGCTLEQAAWARRFMESIAISAIPHWVQNVPSSGRRRLTGQALINSLKQFCKNGHDLGDPAIVWVRTRRDGGQSRTCRLCHKAQAHAWYQARKAGLPKTGRQPPETCPQGHAMEGSNLIIQTDRQGWHHRICRECRNARARDHMRARRARLKAQRDQAA